MSRTYLINNKYPVPPLLFWTVFPAAISLAVLALISLILIAILGPDSDVNVIQILPPPLTIVLLAWGAYTGVGVAVLWLAMWVYWAKMDRSSLPIRACWFLVLLFGMHLGAVIYAFYIWKTGRIKAATSHPVPGSAK
jgi:hypothetical protein